MIAMPLLRNLLHPLPRCTYNHVLSLHSARPVAPLQVPVRRFTTSYSRGFQFRAVVEDEPMRRSLLNVDGRQRMGNFFAPTGGIATKDVSAEETHDLLMRAGFLRQAHSGIFHLLPLGTRVHEKIEKLIDKHMRAIEVSTFADSGRGASKLALSSISSEALWRKSDRLEKGGAELIRFQDRKETKLLLSPTHEEEITTLVASLVTSYKQLPLRLYQISRKYRDERRPRAGLLRGREFTMKDLYTFDQYEALAMKTYKEVTKQYQKLFKEMGIPYIMAEADSGNMGGNVSHEFHYPCPSGEDVVVKCSSCSYSANEACAETSNIDSYSEEDCPIAIHHYITKDRKTLINIFYPQFRAPYKPHQLLEDGESSGTALKKRKQAGVESNEVNPYRIKELVPDLDPSVHNPVALFVENFTEYDPNLHKPLSSTEPQIPPPKFSQIINFYDCHLPTSYHEPPSTFSNHSRLHPLLREHNDLFFASKDIPTTSITTTPTTDSNATSDPKPLNLLKIHQGDPCPRCTSGSLSLTSAIELGHTFHLGTRYSAPLNAKIENEENNSIFMEMGCHGIGVSRLIAAVAEEYRSPAGVGLGWPRCIAPFEVIIVPGDSKKGDFSGKEGVDSEKVYDVLSGKRDGGEEIDVLLDDRTKSFAWKIKDADLIGYPVVVILGRKWKSNGEVEVQCNRKKLRKYVPLEELRELVVSLLSEL